MVLILAIEEIDRLRAVNAAQHAELLALRAAVARVRAFCADDQVPDVLGNYSGGYTAARRHVLAALGDPGREDAP